MRTAAHPNSFKKKALIHLCSFFHTNQVHRSLFDQIRLQTGYHQIVVVPTKNRGQRILVQETELGTMVEVPCLNLATSLSSVYRGHRIYRMLLSSGFLDQVAAYDIELIHAHSAYMDGFAASHLALALQADYALSFRATDVQFCFRYRPHASVFMKKLIRESAKLVVIAVGDANRTAQRFKLDPDSLYILGSGVDDHYVHNALLHKPFQEPRTPRFLTTGKLSYPYKRVDLTLRCCELAAKAMGQTQWSLQILGMTHDDFRKTYRTKVPVNLLENHVTFLGRIDSRDEVLQLMRQSSVFVLPSKETFGIAFLEAISQCTSVVPSTRHTTNQSDRAISYRPPYL